MAGHNFALTVFLVRGENGQERLQWQQQLVGKHLENGISALDVTALGLAYI